MLKKLPSQIVIEKQDKKRQNEYEKTIIIGSIIVIVAIICILSFEYFSKKIEERKFYTLSYANNN